MRDEQRELIIRLRESDPAAFRDLYRDTQKMLYQYALYKLNGNAEAAQDVVADAFMDAMDHAPGLTLNHNLKAWLYRIVHAKVVDWIRKQSRRGAWLRKTAPLMEEERGGGGPEENTVREEDIRLIRAAFFRLEKDSQELLRQKYLEHKKTREMALKLGKSEKAVESLLYRAKKEFSEALARIGKEKIYLPNRDEGTWESLFQIIF